MEKRVVQQPSHDWHLGPGKTPGCAEGQDLDQAETPIVDPGKTPGCAEGEPLASPEETPRSGPARELGR
jgi:hypothetical protein